MADVVTVPNHLAVPEVRTYMTVEVARDLAREDTPGAGVGRRSGAFGPDVRVDVVVRAGGVERRATAHGQDIYAVTAPLVVEAVRRILAGHTRTAGVSLGRRHVRRSGLPPGRRPRTYPLSFRA